MPLAQGTSPLSPREDLSADAAAQRGFNAIAELTLDPSENPRHVGRQPDGLIDQAARYTQGPGFAPMRPSPKPRILRHVSCGDFSLRTIASGEQGGHRRNTGAHARLERR